MGAGPELADRPDRVAMKIVVRVIVEIIGTGTAERIPVATA